MQAGKEGQESIAKGIQGFAPNGEAGADTYRVGYGTVIAGKSDLTVTALDDSGDVVYTATFPAMQPFVIGANVRELTTDGDFLYAGRVS